MRLEKMLLAAGVAVPILYFANLFLSALLYPGYSHITQYASELGSSSALYPAVFNTGILLTGVATVAAGVGFFVTLRRLSTYWILALMVGVCMVLFGVSFMMGGLFPMPDDRHGAYGLGLGVHLVPILLVVALWKHPGLRPLTLFVLVNAVIFLTLFAIMMGVGGLVTRANVGIWQRVYALSMLPWVGVVSYALLRYLDAVRGNHATTHTSLTPSRSIR